MVELMLQLELFELEKSGDGCKKVVALSSHCLGRRMCQAGIGFDGFMEDLDVPAFLIECREAGVSELEVA